MTPEEKIKEATKILLKDQSPQKMSQDLKELFTTEASSPERWLVDEIVHDSTQVGNYSHAEESLPENRKKLLPSELAATVGSLIKDAKWAAINRSGVMNFFQTKPKYNIDSGEWIGIRTGHQQPGEPAFWYEKYCIPCPVKNPMFAFWLLEDL